MFENIKLTYTSEIIIGAMKFHYNLELQVTS